MCQHGLSSYISDCISHGLLRNTQYGIRFSKLISMQIVDAILVAGGVPGPGDPLYPLTRGQPKALLEIAGRPMIQWVLEALDGAQTIRNVVVVGLPAESGLTCGKPLAYLPDAGSLVDNVLAGARWVAEQNDPATYGLLVSADIPAITPAMVDWNVATSLQTDHEAYYSVISKQVMEARFPGARRTYFRVTEGRFTAGDMSLMAVALAQNPPPLVRELVKTRKNIPRQAQVIGLGMLVKFALGQLSLEESARRIGQRLGLRGRVLVSPYAEIGMDVDKPHQHEMLTQDLARSVR